jgi:hypothetical protein
MRLAPVGIEGSRVCAQISIFYRSASVVGSAEHGAATEHRYRTVFAHRDHGRTFVVVAVAPARRMPSTAKRLDEPLRSLARHQPHT